MVNYKKATTAYSRNGDGKMIVYATKQTFERYSSLMLPQDLMPPLDLQAKAVFDKDKEQELLQWGAKIFYFDKRKCIQVVNFASKFTLFLVDVKVEDIVRIDDLIVFYLLKIYENDKPMTRALSKMFKESPELCFGKLTNRSMISTLNQTQGTFLEDGYRLYDFIDNGILDTIGININVNFSCLFGQKINGKVNYIYPGDLFRELVLAKYYNSNNLQIVK